MLTVNLREPLSTHLPFDDMVSGLVTHFKELWWGYEPSLPDLGRTYSLNEKKAREGSLGYCLNGL